jgi:methyltransferase (TIGR00027 family)
MGMTSSMRSKTAEYVAVYRALETTERERRPLFEDPYAALFLTPALAWAVRGARIRPLRRALVRYADLRAPGARTSAIGRTRFIDDVVRRTTAGGIQQAVLLGAGYDCRAHRMPELRTARVFEVDQSEILATKRARLQASGRALHPDVTSVAVNFAHDDLADALVAAGFDRTRPALLVWEGVTGYLDAASVARVMSFVGRLAPGTCLVFTYLHRGLLDGSVRFAGGERLLRNVQRLGEPWKFGLVPETVPSYLERFGLLLREDLGADEYRRRFLGGDAATFFGYAFYRIALAEVAAADRNAR